MTDNILGPEDVAATAFDRPYTVSIVTHGVDVDGNDELQSYVYTIQANTPTNASMYSQALCVKECEEDGRDWQMMFVVAVFEGDHEALEIKDAGSLLPDQVDGDEISFYSKGDEPIDLDPEGEPEKPVQGGLFDFS